MFMYHIDINDYLMLSFGTIQIVMIPNDYLPVWEKWQKYLPKKIASWIYQNFDFRITPVEQVNSYLYDSHFFYL